MTARTAKLKAAEKPQEAPAGTVEVAAAHPFQIGYEGVVVGPGESIAVPADVAEKWVASGLAVPVAR